MVPYNLLKAKKVMLTLVGVWLCLNLLDIHSTALAMSAVDWDLSYEANPFMKGKMEKDGFWAASEFKFLSGSLAILIVFGVMPMRWTDCKKYRKVMKVYLFLAGALVGVYAGIVASNYVGWYLLS